MTRDLFYVPPANKLFNLGDRYLNILHTRQRLKNCALNYYLYLMNCIESPSCICGAFKEDVTHYLMLSSIVLNAGNNWLCLSLSQQVHSLLNGLPMLNFHANSAIFTAVRLFIEQSARFK